MVIITSTANTIKYVSGDNQSVIAKSSVEAIELCGSGSRKGSYVQVLCPSAFNWAFDNDGDRGDNVDTVNGTKSTDNETLFNQLIGLLD